MDSQKWWKKIIPLMKKEGIAKLNMGCGTKVIPGCTTIDFNAAYKPDFVHDLNQYPYPFEDNSFDFVFCSQVIEHLNDTVKTLEEIARITKHDGMVYIGVPHYSSRIAFADPTHVRHFAATTFSHYLPEGCYMSLENLQMEVVDMRMTFSKLYWLFLIPLFANAMPRFYEDHLAGIFPAKFIDVLLRVKKK